MSFSQSKVGGNLKHSSYASAAGGLIAGLLIACSFASADEPKNILIVVEGSSDLKNHAMGGGRQLATLMGHFNTKTVIKGVEKYVAGEMNGYDYIFYFGFSFRHTVPARFTADVLQSTKPIIWLNTGFQDLSAQRGVREKFGFFVSKLDSTSIFETVKFNDKVFVKGDANLNIIELVKGSHVNVLATTSSSKTKKELPYIVQSKNLMYVADSPMSYAGDNDRYLLFADLLHDILREQHEESHSALIRIEDVTPMENPDKLRDIADILGERGIPFLVGVVPFYVDPGENIRLSLSDKPEIVDALKYMVASGATIVMHGVTHQYKGVTAADFEFWDEATNKPIKGETVEAIERKLELGIQEFMKNGLYPLIWETPHYTASFQLYQTIAKYFSTAMEQRLSIEDFAYGQFFPYIINRDLFGQKVLPENLGYIPLDPDREKSRGYVKALVANAKTNLSVRDGFASNFFHAFVNLDLLKELVDSIQALGYTYIDVKDWVHWVKTKDRVILSGSQSYTIMLDDQYLLESYFDKNGEIVRRIVSDQRLKGKVKRDVELQPGEFYKAEPAEFREHERTFAETVVNDARKIFSNVFKPVEAWKEARVAILWNYYARGAALNDQASLAAVFKSVNLRVDTIFIGQKPDLARYNLLIVPFASVDSLQQADYDAISAFVELGGHLITEQKSSLAEDFGIRFSTTRLKVSRVRDKYFPEEKISWRYSELMTKFEADNVEEVFAVDEVTEAPLVIGKQYGEGKFIFIGTRFDPYSDGGYSMYPYLLEYVRKYFKLGPVIRRDQLEMYFDPGFRHTISIEQLVKQWVSQGIRIIHVAGWHEYPKYTYDYQRLINVAHANGILVYAWLEPPQVSQKFWNEHPQWREKNYRGEDVTPSWRYPVALTEKACVDTMAEIYMRFLNQYDWDGVNLAELYFEAGKGFDEPQYFTPMHPSAQREVKRKYGIDLKSIFDPKSPFYWKSNPAVKAAITDYRVNVITGVYETLLPRFKEIERSKPGFQIIVTAMDSYGSPELREYIADDMSRLIEMQKKYDFLLQVEDPESKWSKDPMRYVYIGKQYADLLGSKEKLLLDLNILTFRKPDVVTPFPTLIQTGTESFHLVRAASLGAPRATIYAESSVNPQDMIFLPYALASEVSYTYTADGYTVSSPYSFTLKLPEDHKAIKLNGVPVSAFRENMFLIPAGTHTISTNVDETTSFSTHSLQTRIMSINGNLLSVSYGMRSVTFEYESATRAFVSINREPASANVDGAEYQFTALKGNDCYTVMLPSGKHHVEIVGGDTFAYGVNLTSFWSSTAIAIFGTIAVILLVLMFIAIRIVRYRVEQA